jgi:hypothetical protein
MAWLIATKILSVDAILHPIEIGRFKHRSVILLKHRA